MQKNFLKNETFSPILLLASASPRREQILREAGFKFQLFPVKVSESLKKNLNIQDQIQQIALDKWLAAKQQWQQKISTLTGTNLTLSEAKTASSVILTADTMVVFNGQALGKPHDSEEAIQMLQMLSGNAHEVMTAICLGSNLDESPNHKVVISKVKFRPILIQEIKDYVATGDPLDKAGSYGIQGEAKKFVSEYEGSFDNIVGLPLNETSEMILNFYIKNHWSPPRDMKDQP